MHVRLPAGGGLRSRVAAAAAAFLVLVLGATGAAPAPDETDQAADQDPAQAA